MENYTIEKNTKLKNNYYFVDNKAKAINNINKEKKL